jgi:hypothetical protein
MGNVAIAKSAAKHGFAIARVALEKKVNNASLFDEHDNPQHKLDVGPYTFKLTASSALYWIYSKASEPFRIVLHRVSTKKHLNAWNKIGIFVDVPGVSNKGLVYSSEPLQRATELMYVSSASKINDFERDLDMEFNQWRDKNKELIDYLKEHEAPTTFTGKLKNLLNKKIF